MKFDKRLILLLPVLSGIMWSSGGIFTRTLHDFGFGSLSIFSTKIVLATLILFVILLIFDRESLKIDLKDIWLFIGSGILGALLVNICYNEAAVTGSLSLASLLLGMAPLFALSISAIIFKEKITSLKIVCLTTALIGCLLVSGLLEDSGLSWSANALIFGFASAFFWALYGIFSKLAVNKGYSTTTIIFYSFLLDTIVLTPFTDWNLFANFLVSNPQTDISIALLHSLVTSIVPYFLFSFALKYVDNGEATILSDGTEPIFATVWGALIYAEYPSMLNLIGMCITITALSVFTHFSSET